MLWAMMALTKKHFIKFAEIIKKNTAETKYLLDDGQTESISLWALNELMDYFREENQYFDDAKFLAALA